MKNLYLICLLFIISACGTPTTEDRITFTQVDPFLKVFRESNFFPEYNETEEVAAGEHATFQFAVRAALPLKELSAQVTAFTNEKGTQLQSSPRTGFVDYVRVGRQTPDRAKDAITSLSHYYPDPIIEHFQYTGPVEDVYHFVESRVVESIGSVFFFKLDMFQR